MAVVGGGWFGILEVARTWKGEGFTAPELADTVGLKGSGEKTPAQVAAHWLYKFKLWGYVEVVGTRPSGSIKPLNVYTVTQKGRTCKPRAGRDAQLQALLVGVAVLKKVRGTKAEGKAMTELFDLAENIEGA